MWVRRTERSLCVHARFVCGVWYVVCPLCEREESWHKASGSDLEKGPTQNNTLGR
jgi:hypothetical protein